ncbi:phosphate ABC transporter substrate-binding protein [Xylanivirga thermophila]|uniref:phosphate ABC transporter substrate-binding protein n=1 Tax=Xylanivirga thermophila TaxID=2496273 RepID=UPI00101DACC4|nr:phosphate ABC transporter substrate-binding protein [Xylanivirga thermophila]
MKKYVTFLFVVILVTVSISGCSSGKEIGEYSFGGSTTLEPIITSAIEVFEQKHVGVKLSYDAQGSSAGIKGVTDGIYTLAGASRELNDDEKAEGLVEKAIALDGIAVIVNGETGIEDLTLSQVAEIFSGEIRNWKDIGGSDVPIVVINRDEASGTRSSFKELVLDKVFGKDKDTQFIAEGVVTDSNGDMVVKVGTTPGAIGYCGLGYINEAVTKGAIAIKIDGVEPTDENVLNNRFPIARKLNVVSKGELQGGSVEKQFVDFLLSEEGQGIISENGFIGLR